MALKAVEDLWQFNKNVSQRNEHMLSQELATDVTFRVSGSLQGLFSLSQKSTVYTSYIDSCHKRLS